jgi:hypothetical protein
LMHDFMVYYLWLVENYSGLRERGRQLSY